MQNHISKIYHYYEIKLWWYINYYHTCSTNFIMYIFMFNCMFLCRTYGDKMHNKTLPTIILSFLISSCHSVEVEM